MSNHQQQQPQQRQGQDQSFRPDKRTYVLIQRDAGVVERARMYASRKYQGTGAHIVQDIDPRRLTEDATIIAVYRALDGAGKDGEFLETQPIKMARFMSEDGEGQLVVQTTNLRDEDGRERLGLTSTIVNACNSQTWNGRPQAVISARINADGKLMLTGCA